jgi:hypothetical protein
MKTAKWSISCIAVPNPATVLGLPCCGVDIRDRIKS